MARIRTVKPEFFRHEELQDLENEHAALRPMLVYQGLWTQSDRAGRFQWRPRHLKLDILPFVTFDLAASMELLRKHKFIRRYEVDGKAYGVIPTFTEHQRFSGKEATEKPRYPAPPDDDPPDDESNNGYCRNGELPGNFPGASPGSNGEAVENPGMEYGGRRKDLAGGPPAVGKNSSPKGTRERNPLLDALVGLDGSDPLKATSPAFSAAAKALKTIREVSPQVSAAEIHRRAANYPLHMKDAMISPPALAKHWALCEQAPKRKQPTPTDDGAAAALRASTAKTSRMLEEAKRS